MSDLEQLKIWAKSLNLPRSERETPAEQVQTFLVHSGALLSVRDDEKIQWLGKYDVCPLFLLTDPRFDIDFVNRAMAETNHYSHVWGEQGLLLIEAPELFNPQAVACFSKQILEHESLKYVLRRVFSKYEEQTSDRNMGQGFAQKIMSKPHSLEALKVWNEWFPIPRTAVESALRCILMNNYQNVFKNYSDIKDNMPVLETLQFYIQMCNPDPELFRNISLLWGVVREPTDRLEMCMDIVGQLSQTCGIDEIVSHVDSVENYTYFKSVVQQRLQERLSKQATVVYTRMHEICSLLEKFDEQLYPILTQHNFSVAASANQRIMGDTPMTAYSYWVWDAFLKHATSEQWRVYLNDIARGDRLTVGTHDELKCEPFYMQKLLQQHIQTPHASTQRKM